LGVFLEGGGVFSPRGETVCEKSDRGGKGGSYVLLQGGKSSKKKASWKKTFGIRWGGRILTHLLPEKMGEKNNPVKKPSGNGFPAKGHSPGGGDFEKRVLEKSDDSDNFPERRDRVKKNQRALHLGKVEKERVFLIGEKRRNPPVSIFLPEKRMNEEKNSGAILLEGTMKKKKKKPPQDATSSQGVIAREKPGSIRTRKPGHPTFGTIPEGKTSQADKNL